MKRIILSALAMAFAVTSAFSQIILTFSGNPQPLDSLSVENTVTGNTIKMAGNLELRLGPDYSATGVLYATFFEWHYQSGALLKLTGISGANKAIKMLAPLQNQAIVFTFYDCTDAGGKNYSTIVLGNQQWMAENLDVGTMVNGSQSGRWQNNNNIIEKYCYMDNPANCSIYGGLYDWEELMNYQAGATGNTTVQGICPDGWHVPRDEEWKALEMYLGMPGSEADKINSRGTNEGDMLKESGTGHWISPNTGNNTSGFTALPAGNRHNYALLWGTLYSACYFHSATLISGKVVARYLQSSPFLGRSINNQTYNDALSVRCVRNSEYPVYTSISDTICFGESYLLGTRTLNKAGIYTEKFTSLQGYDSIVTIDLFIKDKIYSEISATICSGEAYSLGGISYSVAGMYNQTFSAANGCDSIVYLYLNVDEPVSIVNQPENKTVHQGESVQFTVAVSGTEPLSYQWKKDGINLESQVQESLLISSVSLADTGQYYCVVSNNCKTDSSDAASLKILTNSTREELLTDGEILVYPNPVTSFMIIELPKTVIKFHYTLKIIDPIGQSVFTSQIQTPINRINTDSFFRKGIYLIQLTDKFQNVMEIKKVILN